MSTRQQADVLTSQTGSHDTGVNSWGVGSESKHASWSRVGNVMNWLKTNRQCKEGDTTRQIRGPAKTKNAAR